MHVSVSSRALVRRLAVTAVAAAALCIPVVEMSAHAHSAPSGGTHAVAAQQPDRLGGESASDMPVCENHWAPICDRW